jgi:DNA modification methylase
MLIQANCSHALPLADNSVQCIITSPPYYALRNYGVAGRLGLENTWREWLDNMVAVFMECHRVLRPDGVMWLNIGDKYCNTGGRGRGGNKARYGRAYQQEAPARTDNEPGFKYKDLMGLPWRLAIALQDRGWWLRRDLIWNKPTAMPESVRDRNPTSHEYIFQLTKSGYYFWNKAAMMEPTTGNAHSRGKGVSPKTQKLIKFPQGWDVGQREKSLRGNYKHKHNESFSLAVRKVVSERQRRSVWTVAAQPFKGSHFATFPPRLIEPMMLASTRPGDIVLDPFSGAGTVGLVAERNGRKWIGLELNWDYLLMARQRIEEDKEVRLARMTKARTA